MDVNYITLIGEIITQPDLRIRKAREVANAIKKLDYFSLLGLRRISCRVDLEAVVFEVDVEVGQVTKYDIRSTERIAVRFSAADILFPEVLALREDFPKVPHLNIRDYEKPRNLCLFDEKYSEFKLRWTPTLFLERIREWLALTAKGELHDEDQPLEPLLIGSPMNLVIPFDLCSRQSEGGLDLLVIRRVDYGENATLIAEHIEDITLRADELNYIATAVLGETQPHGIIHRKPTNLFELHGFLEKANVDLLSELRSRLPGFKAQRKDQNILDVHLVIIAYLPKTRTSGATVEGADIWAFLIEGSIKEIGIEIGIWEITEGVVGALVPCDQTKKGEKARVQLLNPTISFSRELACKVSGFPQTERKGILLIGGGALGSQVLTNLIRMGFGEWRIVDEDCLLPHNLGRHALPGEYVGYSKAEALAYQANSIIRGKPIAEAIVANVLNPLASEERMKSIYEEVHLLIDASTSIAVARHITRDIASSARRISTFLNPSGHDVVILAEDEKRNSTLDCLEMQYYRYLINEPDLKDHLQQKGSSIRYARTCRDVSSTIPQDLVALHSAVCSRGIRNISLDSSESISIWRANTSDFSVKHYQIPTSEIIEEKIDDWTLCYDKWLTTKIHKARKERLPNETGGVLIGSFDVQRKIVYIVDTILSPPDSIEWPTVYIRGAKGLKERVDEIQKTTAEMLDYVGEWHSHPDGCSTKPSEDDIKAFTWLAEMMDVYGLPALMVIAGDQNQQFWYLGQMK